MTYVSVPNSFFFCTRSITPSVLPSCPQSIPCSQWPICYLGMVITRSEVIYKQVESSGHLVPVMTRSGLESILTRAAVHFLDEFFSVWPIDSIMRVSLTNFRLHSAIRAYKCAIWDPDIFFSRWFARPESFRRILGRCNAVVSGSQALQFFDRTEYLDSDLDIFMRGFSVDVLDDWLKEAGYNMVGERDEYQIERRMRRIAEDDELGTERQSAIRAVFSYARYGYDGAFGGVRARVVQIIVVCIDPIEFIIFDFHSSTCLSTRFELN